MSKALWNEELAMIVLGQFHRHMLAVSRGTLTNIHSNIEYSTLHAAHQLALGERWTLEMQASHHTITTHTLIILAEVYLVTKNRSHFLIELSFAETLEEVTTRVAEKA